MRSEDILDAIGNTRLVGIPRMSPKPTVRLWAKHLKAYEWSLIPEAGHAVAWEQPEAFNQSVLAFLRKH